MGAKITLESLTAGGLPRETVGLFLRKFFRERDTSDLKKTPIFDSEILTAGGLPRETVGLFLRKFFRERDTSDLKKNPIFDSEITPPESYVLGHRRDTSDRRRRLIVPRYSETAGT